MKLTSREQHIDDTLNIFISSSVVSVALYFASVSNMLFETEKVFFHCRKALTSYKSNKDSPQLSL